MDIELNSRRQDYFPRREEILLPCILLISILFSVSQFDLKQRLDFNLLLTGQPLKQLISGDSQRHLKVTLAECAVSSEKMKHIYHLCGILAVYRGDLNTAENYLTETPRQDIRRAIPRLLRSLASHHELEERTPYLRLAYQLAPADIGSIDAFLSQLLRYKAFPEAFKLLKTVEARKASGKLSVSQMQVNLWWGRYFHSQGDWEASAHLYRQATQDTQYAKAGWDGLARIAWDRTNYKLAIKYYKRAIEIEPTHDTNYALIGTLYNNYLGQPLEAIPYYEKYVEYTEERNRPQALLKLTQVYMAVGRYTEAEIVLERAWLLSDDGRIRHEVLQVYHRLLDEAGPDVMHGRGDVFQQYLSPDTSGDLHD